MPTNHPMRFCWLLAGLLPVLACSHDKRDNPLDPALTPPVDLQVSLNDTTGKATLIWTPYSGSQQFTAYVVLRRPRRLVEVDTLIVIDDAKQTSFVDSALSPDTAYEYRLSVISNSLIRRLTLDAVEIEVLAINSRTATVRWSEYSGPRFERYRVLRRSAEETIEERGVLLNRGELTFADSGLVGNRSYSYSVEVVTDRNEGIASDEESGIIHPLVDSWPLDLVEGSAVRLYRDEEGVKALISSKVEGISDIRLVSYSGDGRVTEEDGFCRDDCHQPRGPLAPAPLFRVHFCGPGPSHLPKLASRGFSVSV